MYLQLAGTNVRLLGSTHLFPATRRRTPPWVAEAYDWAEALIFESDAPTLLPFLKADPQEGAPKLQPSMPPDLWSQLETLWPAAGPLAPLAGLRPWAVLVVAPTLFQQVVEGVEPRMLRSAITQAKPYAYLETAQDVAAALESIPLQAVSEAISMLMADREEPQRTLERMHAAWLEGDLQAVYEVAAESPVFNLPGIRHAILDGRNRAWAARLKTLLDRQERTLVVVGALHLGGPGSLIECLAHPVNAVF